MDGDPAMMTEIRRVHHVPRNLTLRTVAVVSRHPHQHVIETLLGAVDHDVVFVESIANAYSHIKRLSPDLIVVCVSADDVDGCQVLSMLKLDAETSRIPVVTYATPWSDASDDDPDGENDAINPTFVMSMN
jgi:CheY-like chemotaxis protein